MTVRIERSGPVTTVVLDRPETRNAIDRATAEALARDLAALPQDCLRNDRLAAYEGLELPFDEAMANEFRHGLESIRATGLKDVARFLAR